MAAFTCRGRSDIDKIIIYRGLRGDNTPLQPDHYHGFYEIFCLLSGKCRFLLRDQVHELEKGDLVFIYLSAPIQKIRFACQVVEADEKAKRMKLRKIKRYDDEFPIERLKENGLLAVRSARHVPKALETLLLEKMGKT